MEGIETMESWRQTRERVVTGKKAVHTGHWELRGPSYGHSLRGQYLISWFTRAPDALGMSKPLLSRNLIAKSF